VSEASVAAPLPPATKLALDRTRLAYDRTLLAWVRTATSLISFGFTIYKFFQYLREDKQVVHPSAFGPREFALLMIATGIVTLLLATIDHRRNMQTLRAEYGYVPYSLSAVLAGFISILGVVGLVVVLFRQ
jgi:putative membrane protein